MYTLLLTLLACSNIAVGWNPKAGHGHHTTSSTTVATATTAAGSESTTGSTSTNGTTSSSSSGGTYTGDITYYSPSDGTGSCGQTFSDSDMVCALSTAMMANGANPNDNPKCYTSITLTNPTNPGSWQAKIVSTCAGCAYSDVDLSPALFKAVAPTGDGRVSGIQWKFD